MSLDFCRISEQGISVFRQTDRQTVTAQVKVLSCAFAAKKSSKKCVLNYSEWPETDFEPVFKKLTRPGVDKVKP